MADSAPAPRHTLRWVAIGIVVVLAALVVAFAIYVHSLLQPQRFTTLLENNLAAAGLRLRMQAPAEPALFPRPAVRLHAFTLTTMGSDTPVLRADGATIVVPWRALLHGEVAIERIEVEAPRIDIGQIQSLLAQLPEHAAGPPRLPTVTTGVQMSHGTLTRNGSPLLFGVSIRTGALAPGKPFRLDAAAHTSGGRSFVAAVDTVPSEAHDGVIDFNPVHVLLTGQPDLELQADGQGSWRGGADLGLQLKGTLQHRAPAPPSTRTAAAASTAAASASPSPATVTDKIAIEVLPARGSNPLTVALKLDGDDAHVDMRMQPTQFGSWWSRMLTATPDQPPGPLPLTGTAQVRELELGWFKATGLRIEADPDLAPSGAASAPPPAPARTAAAASPRKR